MSYVNNPPDASDINAINLFTTFATMGYGAGSVVPDAVYAQVVGTDLVQTPVAPIDQDPTDPDQFPQELPTSDSPGY